MMNDILLILLGIPVGVICVRAGMWMSARHEQTHDLPTINAAVRYMNGIAVTDGYRVLLYHDGEVQEMVPVATQPKDE